MEACFLTSNSIVKSLELLPTVKARPLSSPVSRGSIVSLYHGKRYAIPYPTTRCHASKYSPLDEDSQPFHDADWRSFRARLVTNEPVIMLVDDQSFNPDTATECPPMASVRNKWAHTIHEPEKGCLLIATEKLDEVHIFERTVILLLSTGPVGPFGIILNRPSLMSIKETQSAMTDISDTFANRPLFFGGPMEEGLFLMSPRRGHDTERVSKSGVFEEVMKGLYYGTKESVGCASEMVKRNVVGVGDFRFFDGYCGWDKEQLRDEINGGLWTVIACSPSVVGLGNMITCGLWEEVLGLMVPKKVW